MAISEENTETLKSVIDQLCSAKNVYQGRGPTMAYFQTSPDANGAVKRFTYVAFSIGGIKSEGTRALGAETFGEALKSSTLAFDEWLQRGRTLVWRTYPEAEQIGDLWYVYWRCVQLDDGARSLPVEWCF